MIKEMLNSIDNRQGTPTNLRSPNPDLRQFADAANLANDYDNYDAAHHNPAHTNAPGKRVIVEDLLSRTLGRPSMEEELIRRETHHANHAQTAPHPPATRHPDGFYPKQNGEAPGVFFSQNQQLPLSNLPPKPGMPLTPAGTLSSQYDLPPHLPAGQHSMAFSQDQGQFSQNYQNYPSQQAIQQQPYQAAQTYQSMAEPMQQPLQQYQQNAQQQNAPLQQYNQQPAANQQSAPPMQQPTPAPEPVALPAPAPIIMQTSQVQTDLQELRKMAESIKRSSGITNLIMEQVKELVEIDSNLNSKIKEIEVRINQLEEQFNIFKKTADENQRKFQLFDRNMQKFIGLYEIISNQYNPFTAKSNFLDAAQDARRKAPEQKEIPQREMPRNQPAVEIRRSAPEPGQQAYAQQHSGEQQHQMQQSQQEQPAPLMNEQMHSGMDHPDMMQPAMSHEHGSRREQKFDAGKYDARLQELLSQMSVPQDHMEIPNAARTSNAPQRGFEIERLAQSTHRSTGQQEEASHDLNQIQKAIESQVIRQLSDMVRSDRPEEKRDGHSTRFSELEPQNPMKPSQASFAPSIRQEYHQPVEPQFNMRLNNGKEVTNLPQLINAFEEMDENTFSHHVNQDKNDFYNWIKDIIKDESLARSILPLRTKEDMIRAIKFRIYHTV